jgi:Lipoprotein amino terminal region
MIGKGTLHRWLPLVAMGAVLACSRPRELARSSAPEIAPAAHDAAKPSTVTMPARLDPSTPGWELGQEYAYRVKLVSQIGFGESARAVDFDFTGDLVVRPVEVGREEVTLYAAIQNARFASRRNESQAELDRRASKLDVPYFVTLSGGRVTQLGVPKGADPIALGMYRTLCSSLQVVRPLVSEDKASADASKWTASEYDTTGQYEAEYEPLRANRYAKRKLKYLSLLAPETRNGKLPSEIVPNIVSSRGEVDLSEEGRPVRVSLRDELLLTGVQAPMHATTELLLESGPGRRTNAKLDLAALRARVERLTAGVPHTPEVDRGFLDDARMNGLSFETIVERLEELASSTRAEGRPETVADPAREEERAKKDGTLFTALAATFRRQPETANKALAKILAGSPASQSLADALASSGSEAAQSALAEIAASKTVDPEVRDAIVISISRTRQPSRESIRVLTSLLDDDRVGTQALYGLGTFSRLLRERGDQVTSNRLGQLLLARLDKARTGDEVMVCLRAIANSGYTPALPKARSYLADHREQVRVDAVRALRSMKSPEIDGILASALQSDESIDVRTMAIEIAQRREPTDTVTRALARAVDAGVEAHVRYRAAALLAKWLPRRPELRTTLETVAAGDPEAKIRELARAGL